MAEFRSLVLWVHLAAIVLWVGGLLFYNFLLLPMFGKSTPMPHAAADLLAKVLHRFVRYSKEMIGAVLLSGIFNIINSGVMLQFHFTSKYLAFLSVKIVFVIVIIVIHVFHSTRYAPALTQLAKDKQNDITDAFQTLKKQMLRSATLLLCLFAATLFIGLYLRYI